MKTKKLVSVLTYSELNQLNALLGSLKIKSLDRELFVAFLQARVAVEKAGKDYAAVVAEIDKEYGVKRNFDGSVTADRREMQKWNNFNDAIADLGKREIEIDSIRLLTVENFALLHDENDLNVDELTLLNKHMVQVA